MREAARIAQPIPALVRYEHAIPDENNDIYDMSDGKHTVTACSIVCSLFLSGHAVQTTCFVVRVVRVLYFDKEVNQKNTAAGETPGR